MRRCRRWCCAGRRGARPRPRRRRRAAAATAACGRSRRRTGCRCQQVAGAQGEGVRDQRRGCRRRCRPSRRCGRPGRLAVDPGLHPQPVAQVADLGRRDHRAERAGVVAVLAEDPLRGELLRPPRGQVVERRVADDGGQRLVRGRRRPAARRRRPRSRPPSRGRPRSPGPAPRRRRRSATGSSGRTASGSCGSSWSREAALGDVLEVVQPDADHPGVGQHRRDELHVRQPAGSRPAGSPERKPAGVGPELLEPGDDASPARRRRTALRPAHRPCPADADDSHSVTLSFRLRDPGSSAGSRSCG